MEKIIKLLDTTLRDGEQMPGVNLNESDKLRIAYSLAHLGVDAVEAGFPSSSISDFNAVFKIAEQISGTKIVALARAEQKDIDAAYRALKPALDKRIHIFIATSDLHIEQKLNMTRGEVLNRVRQCVTYAKTLFDDVEFSPEDASRSDLEYMISVLKTATECGANVINIPDTVGYSTPTEFGELVKIIKQRVIGTSCVELSVHCHNDLGLAVANTLSAIQNGADWVDCTINGLGERAGNAALEEIVMALDTRKTFFGVTTSVNTTLLSKTSKLVSSITGVYIPPNKAIVGKNAFSHESGIHQHGVLANRETYEIMSPQTIGIDESKIVLGKHSGHHAFKEKLEEIGIVAEDRIVNSSFLAFKNLACRKKETTDEDIRALVEEAVIDSHIIDGYELESYQTQSGNKTKAMALVSMSKSKSNFTEAATGEGPIDASFNAINKIIQKDYKLVFYNIKAVTGGTDALGEVCVRISDGEREYIGKGISTDIIESSIKAYINAINRATINLNERDVCHNEKNS